MSYESESQPRKKKWLILVIIIVVLIVAGAIASAIFLTGTPPAVKTYIEASGTPSSGGNNLIFEENQEKSAKIIKSIIMPGWEAIRIDANTKNVEVDFYNPVANAGNFYLTFALKLADGETLYQSGLIRAGDHVRKITLNRALLPGTYDAIVHIQPYTADDSLTPKNNANVAIKLVAV